MQGGSVVFLKESVIKNTPNIPLKSTRPYVLVRDRKNRYIFWAVPMSGQLNKYHHIVDRKRARFGACHSLYVDRKHAYLIQNMVPVTAADISRMLPEDERKDFCTQREYSNVARKVRRCLSLLNKIPPLKVTFTPAMKLYAKKEKELNRPRLNLIHQSTGIERKKEM